MIVVISVWVVVAWVWVKRTYSSWRVSSDFYSIITQELEAIEDGSMKWGTEEIYDYKKGGLNLVVNEYFEKEVPAEVKAKYDEICEKLRNGEIEVSSAIGASTSEIQEMYKKAAPFSK